MKPSLRPFMIATPLASHLITLERMRPPAGGWQSTELLKHEEKKRSKMTPPRFSDPTELLKLEENAIEVIYVFNCILRGE